MAVGDSAEEILASALLGDADEHSRGRYDQLGSRYDDVYAALLPLMERNTPTVAMAYEFWDGWIDSRNHDWQYYAGIGRDDWPHLAAEIAQALRGGTEIRNPVLIEHFGPRQPTTLRQRLRGRLGRGGLAP